MKRFLTTLAVLMMGAIPGFAQNSNANPRALEAAMAHFNANARAYGLTNPNAELKQRNSIADELGQTHIRYDQYFNGVKVFEGEAIAHVDRGNNVRVTNAIHGNLGINTTPSIAQATAVAVAAAAVAPNGGYDTRSELQILPAGPRSASTRLVWHVTVDVENDVDGRAQWEQFVDAKSGSIVWSFNGLETSNVTGTGKTQYLGDKPASLDLSSATYYLRDVARSTGNYTCDKGNKTNAPACTTFSNSTGIFGDGILDSSNRGTSAADAHVGLQFTWDYFTTSLGRKGIDNTGKSTSSRVHYGNAYDNAFWSDSCFCMTYGDGSGTPGGSSGFLPLVSIDVAGHEMTHGVTSTSSNLTYSGESGGLNEGTSDIFGTFVEYYAASTKDPGDWLIGEVISPSNWNADGTWKNLANPKALRYMYKPSIDGSSADCWYSGVGSLNVHYSSGPINHMMYMLVNGTDAKSSSCTGSTVTGIGATAAAKIWYRALTVYMVSSETYAQSRAHAVQAAKDLAVTLGADYSANVASAFSAISVP